MIFARVLVVQSVKRIRILRNNLLCEYSLMVKRQFSKLRLGVRFSLLALTKKSSMLDFWQNYWERFPVAPTGRVTPDLDVCLN